MLIYLYIYTVKHRILITGVVSILSSSTIALGLINFANSEINRSQEQTKINQKNYIDFISGSFDKIDNYDIVIRFNKGIISNHAFTNNVGRKTDIWIYNFKDPSILEMLPKDLPQLLFCPYPKEKIDSYFYYEDKNT